MSQSNVPATMPHVRPTPGQVLGTLRPPTVNDLVDKIIETIPADMRAVTVKALVARTRERLSVQEIRKRLEDDASEMISGRIECFIESLRDDFGDELREYAISVANDDAAEAIENDALDDFIYDLAYLTVLEELNDVLLN